MSMIFIWWGRCSLFSRNFSAHERQRDNTSEVLYMVKILQLYRETYILVNLVFAYGCVVNVRVVAPVRSFQRAPNSRNLCLL